MQDANPTYYIPLISPLDYKNNSRLRYLDNEKDPLIVTPIKHPYYMNNNMNIHSMKPRSNTSSNSSENKYIGQQGNSREVSGVGDREGVQANAFQKK